MDIKRLVIVGYGMAAQRLLEALAGEGQSAIPLEEITVVGEEGVSAYDRVNLASALDPGRVPSLCFAQPRLPEHVKVEYLPANRAEALLLDEKQIRLQDGRHIVFDAIVLATGADAARPPLSNVDAGNCFVFRDIKDAEKIAANAKEGRKLLIVGGGLLGIELARHMHERGLRVSIIEYAPHLMPLQMDEQGAAVIARKLRAMGVEVFTNTLVEEILLSGERASGVRIRGGVLEADFIVFATGIRPRDALAKAAGLTLGSRGGIVVDNYCRTNHPAVLAIGDCTVFHNQIAGLVAPAYLMAAAVAKTICSGKPQLVELPAICAKLKFPDCEAVSFGDCRGVTSGAQTAVMQAPNQNLYRKLVTSGDSTQLLGGILVGDISKYSEHLYYVNSLAPLEDRLLGMLMPQQGEQEGENELPDGAVVCSCRNVTKGDLVRAIRDKGCENVADIKQHTQAGTGCGGCIPAISEILDKELKKSGRAKRKVLCEHFAHTRQELFQLVRQHKLQSWPEILEKWGRGEGCEICKPAVASILASLWNRHILDPGLTLLQDTNDAFLANIQKDGRYSVVPRIAGGEISPEQIEKMGRIGHKYGLYGKITGGQRIDFFGAHVDDLPAIWKDLLDAGFESGHAYGKALRTVKSCVGNVWCRYGMQDSTDMAIKLELRYRGLRAPHKIKSAVSGCARECAEAQNKDFGLIATQNGWNLFVCGNGAKPQHAQLLASDIDAETVFKYVDRFLMYYIRTADRLERTATWLNKLEGGIETLRQVVIDDSLGLGDELESEMAAVRSGFHCEWAETLKDPRKLARFRTYVNADRTQAATSVTPGVWFDVCGIDDILPETGVCALVGNVPVAVFRLRPGGAGEERLHALDNFDPASGLSVLSRGLVGDQQGEPKVASPIYKQNYSLRTGVCLDSPGRVVRTWQVRLNAGRVEVLPQ